jgi:hypothetical protein
MEKNKRIVGVFCGIFLLTNRERSEGASLRPHFFAINLKIYTSVIVMLLLALKSLYSSYLLFLESYHYPSIV